MSERDGEEPLRSEEGVPESAPSESVAKAGRRRFIGGAAGVVAMSMLARPAWAGNCSYSGRMSGNLSAPDDEPCGGQGYSAGYWKNHTHEWHEQWPSSMLFGDAFSVDAFPGRTLYDVIAGNSGLSTADMGFQTSDGEPVSAEYTRYVTALTQLGVQSVAALQNAATPVSYTLTVAEVIESFRRAYASGKPEEMEMTKDSFDRLNNGLA